jgi:tetratricopeptide (TPR) repeat protein
MRSLVLAIIDRRNFTKVTWAFLLILAGATASFAQYKGAPVKKDRLLQALRSKQLQSSDIVTIINTNGVDFRVTEEVRKSLIAAGARPEVIKAATENPRFVANNIASRGKARSKAVREKDVAVDYDDLIAQAIYSYKNQKNPKSAVRILESAAKMKPKSAAAYQMLGFIYLYELNNPIQAEKLMREAFAKGGSAVFRVFHDDDGDLRARCSGSLYISQDTLRFESDNNVHTFETSIVNVDRVKLETESSRILKKYSVFKIFLKIGDDKAKFRFTPQNGQLAESKMVERFIAASNSNFNSTAAMPIP